MKHYNVPLIRLDDLTPLQKGLYNAATRALHSIGFANDEKLEEAIESYRQARKAFRESMDPGGSKAGAPAMKKVKP